MQPGYKRENKEVNCSLSEEEHVFPVAFDTALCSQVISNFWCARTLHHTLYECGIPPLNSSCSYLSSQWHHLWRMDAEFPCFMYLQTFPNQVLYWGCKVRVRIKQVRSKLGGSYYLFWVWKCRIRKTWTVSGFQGSVQTQIFFLCVRIWKWTICSCSTRQKWKGVWKLYWGSTLKSYSFKILIQSITSESLSSISSQKIVEDFAFSSHDSKPTNIQKSIAACKNHIQHETE